MVSRAWIINPSVRIDYAVARLQIKITGKLKNVPTPTAGELRIVDGACGAMSKDAAVLLGSLAW